MPDVSYAVLSTCILVCVLRDSCKFPPWCCRWRFLRKLRLMFLDYFCHIRCLRTAHRQAKRCYNRQSGCWQSCLYDPVSGNETSVAWCLGRMTRGSRSEMPSEAASREYLGLLMSQKYLGLILRYAKRLTWLHIQGSQSTVDLISTDIWLTGGIFMEKRVVI